MAKEKFKSKTLTNNQILEILIEKEKKKKKIKEIFIQKTKDILNILTCKSEFFVKFDVTMKMTEIDEDIAI